jgi:uncharacterized protein YaaW (UPF0174 family)
MAEPVTTDKLRRLLSEVAETSPERLEPLFDRHGLEVEDGVAALVDEICLDGANTIASIFRGWEGVAYGEIVRDAAKLLKVRIDREQDSHVEVERKILDHLFREHYAKATDEERDLLDGILRANGVKQASWSTGGVLLTAAITALGQEAAKQVVRQALRVVAGGGAARIATFAVPILGAAMAAWTAADLAGPAFRKTVPTVIDVAILRLEFEEASKELPR